MRIFFQQKSNSFKGLTFIEVLISVFIMGLLVLSSTGAAAIYLRNKSQLQRTQQAMEELNLIANDIAKTIRMSNCDEVDDGAGGTTKCILDNNGNNLNICPTNVNSKACNATIRSNENEQLIQYHFHNGHSGGSYSEWQLVRIISDADGNNEVPTIIADNVAGRIFTKEAIGENYNIPLVIIQLWKVGKDGQVVDQTLVETAVSQRGNYYIE